MASVPTISPNEIPPTLENNQIKEMTLRDGTIIKISPNSIPSNQNNLSGKNITLINKKKKLTKKMQKNSDKKVHNHHRDGLGTFGQHFKTQYSQVCLDCIEGPGGVLKQRKNYILYVSKNFTEEDVSKKRKDKNNYQMYQQMPIQGNIEIQQYQKVQTNAQNEKIISQGQIDCNGVPIIETKPKLRSEQNEVLCPECCEEERKNLQNKNNNLCPECVNEQEENINGEKITTTVKVLVPENENNF